MTTLSRRYGIVVHGGSGIRKSFEDQILASMKRQMRQAVEEGMLVLTRDNGGALDAVETAVASMETSEAFNAGRGSCLTIAKTIEMDAGVMDGRNIKCGAVGAIRGLANPIKVARKVMELTPHALLVGTAAMQFAIANGFRKEVIEVTEYKLQRYEQELLRDKSQVRNQELGTVGAIAIDKNGNLASAVSTGGIWLKMEGRVGDSAIVGAGFYSDNKVGAAVATGNGDAIMKICLSKHVCDLISGGMNIDLACKVAIKELGELQNGWGGVVALDRKGDVGLAYNTEGMARAYLFNDMSSPYLAIFELED